MKQGRVAIILAIFVGLMVQSAWAADVQLSGSVGVSGPLTATSLSGDGSAVTNIAPANIASGTAGINISGNAATVTNGIYSSGSYADPSWITSLAGSKITGDISGNAATATTANSVADRAITPTNIAFYGKTAIVALSGGDYTDPATAMSDYGSWCGTPSATNTCLLKIMPGVYAIDSPVVMQQYIDIEGSGENTTKITSALSGPSNPLGTVEGASNAEIRFLTVENTGTGGYTAAIVNYTNSPSIFKVIATASGDTYNYGVYNLSSSSPTMNNVIATASGGTYNYGVYNYDSSSPTMNNVIATASGGSGSMGVYNYNSSPVMNNVATTGSGAGNSNFGVYNDSSSQAMNNVTATGSGGTYSYGVYNLFSSAVMNNVIATASGGTYSYGVYNQYSSAAMTNVTATGSGGGSNYGVYNLSQGGSSDTVKINHSVISGSSVTIANIVTTTYVGDTQLDGGAVFNNSGTITCAGVYDENYTFYTNTCP